MFYVPLSVPACNPIPECWFAFKKSDVKFPIGVEISRVGADQGNAGLFSHHEFILKLLDVQAADLWNISECNYDQWDLKSMSIINIGESFGRPGQVPAQRAEPSSSSASAPAEAMDWSLFDAPLLMGCQGGNVFADLEDTGAGGLFFGDEDDLFDVEVDSDHELLVAPADAPAAEPSMDQPTSDVESVKSQASASHTKATDFDIVAKTLGSRPVSTLIGDRCCCWEEIEIQLLHCFIVKWVVSLAHSSIIGYIFSYARVTPLC